jgi:hypothetical protein
MALSISTAARRQITNLLTACSLGTLCFIRRWYDLEHLQPRGLDYFRSAPPSSNLLIATVIAAAILSLIFYLAWLCVERFPIPGLRRFAHCVFLLVLLFPIESVRRYWNTQTDSFDIGSNISMWTVETVLLVGFLITLFGSQRVLQPARRVALCLLLLLPALMIDFTLNRLGAEQAGLYQPLTPSPLQPVRNPHSQRFIWLVFDELDQRLAFERRPASLQLPELDRLRAESLVDNHAVQTAMYTAIALPSLISGTVLANAQALDARTLNVQPPGSPHFVPWRSLPNVFSRVKELGVNSEIIGWHHPYCRILGDEAARCLAVQSNHSTAAIAQEVEASEAGVWPTVFDLYRHQSRNLWDMLHSRGEPSSEHLRDSELQVDQQKQYFEIRDEAYRGAADPEIGMLFVHFPTPHMFPIYNRREQSFRLDPSLDYFDNLALVDRTLGELRQAVEKAGLWDRTTILITADHGLRPGAWVGRMGWTAELDRLTNREPPERVPFILKLAGQNTPIDIECAFYNSISADVAVAVLNGQISGSEQAAKWIAQRATESQKPAPALTQAVRGTKARD